MEDWVNFLTEVFADVANGAEGCLIEKDRQVLIRKENTWEPHTEQAPSPCETLIEMLLEHKESHVEQAADFEGSLSLRLPVGLLLINVFHNKSHQIIWCTPLFSREFPSWKTLRLQPEVSSISRQSSGGIFLLGSTDWSSGAVTANLLLKEMEAISTGPIWMIQKWPECELSEQRIPVCRFDVDSNEQILKSLDSALIANSAVIYLNEVSDAKVLQKAVQAANSGITVILRVQAHSADSILRSLWTLDQKQYQQLISLLQGVMCVQYEKGSLLAGNLVLSSEYLYADSALKEYLHANESVEGLDSFFRATSGNGSHRMKEAQARLTKEGILDQNQQT